MGIEVLPPSVNVSANGFTIEQLPADHPAPRQVTAFPFPLEPAPASRSQDQLDGTLAHVLHRVEPHADGGPRLQREPKRSAC